MPPRAVALALVACLFVMPAGAQTPSIPVPERPVVVTTGEGVVRRAPDRAFVMISVETRARNPREAQQRNAELMSAVLAKLQAAGFGKDAIQTRGYDLQPEYDYDDGRQTLRGYIARNTVEVRLDDISRIGEVLDVAVGAGATSAGSIRFDLKDRGAAEREALRQAVDEAQRRAEAAAAAAGLKVERVLRIEEQHAGMPPPIPFNRPELAMARAEAAAPPINPGEIEVRAAVTLTAAVR